MQRRSVLQDDAFVKKIWREVARKRFWTLVERVHGHDIDWVIQHLIGRACLTQENRNCLEEVMAEASEHWEAQKKLTDLYHRPNFRFQKK